MTFSQIWEACFSAALIAFGLLLLWLGLVEPLLGAPGALSQTLITLICLGSACGFVLRRKSRIAAAQRNAQAAADEARGLDEDF